MMAASGSKYIHTLFLSLSFLLQIRTWHSSQILHMVRLSASIVSAMLDTDQHTVLHTLPSHQSHTIWFRLKPLLLIQTFYIIKQTSCHMLQHTRSLAKSQLAPYWTYSVCTILRTEGAIYTPPPSPPTHTYTEARQRAQCIRVYSTGSCDFEELIPSFPCLYFSSCLPALSALTLTLTTLCSHDCLYNNASKND